MCAAPSRRPRAASQPDSQMCADPVAVRSGAGAGAVEGHHVRGRVPGPRRAVLSGQQHRHVGHRVVRLSSRGAGPGQLPGDLPGTGEADLSGQPGQVDGEPVGAPLPGQPGHEQQRGEHPTAVPAPDVPAHQLHGARHGVQLAFAGPLSLAREVLSRSAAWAGERRRPVPHRRPPWPTHRVDQPLLRVSQGGPQRPQRTPRDICTTSDSNSAHGQRAPSTPGSTVSDSVVADTGQTTPHTSGWPPAVLQDQDRSSTERHATETSSPPRSDGAR